MNVYQSSAFLTLYFSSPPLLLLLFFFTFYSCICYFFCGCSLKKCVREREFLPITSFSNAKVSKNDS
jgi:hypothetical protein